MKQYEEERPVGLGDVLAWRIAKDDADLAAWLSRKGVTKKGWVEFLRQVLRDRMQRENNPLAAPSREELAQMMGDLVRNALMGAPIEITPGAAAQQLPEPVVSAIEQKARKNILALGMDDDD